MEITGTWKEQENGKKRKIERTRKMEITGKCSIEVCTSKQKLSGSHCGNRRMSTSLYQCWWPRKFCGSAVGNLLSIWWCLRKPGLRERAFPAIQCKIQQMYAKENEVCDQCLDDNEHRGLEIRRKQWWWRSTDQLIVTKWSRDRWSCWKSMLLSLSCVRKCWRRWCNDLTWKQTLNA